MVIVAWKLKHKFGSIDQMVLAEFVALHSRQCTSLPLKIIQDGGVRMADY